MPVRRVHVIVWSLLARLDSLIARTRPLWRWLGQLALVTLGVHLAADHLDDAAGALLAGLSLPWPDPETPLVAGTWVAVVLELLVVVWSFWSLGRTAGVPAVSWRNWPERASVQAVVAPLAWLPLVGAGCWVVVMAVEDGVATQLPQLAAPVAWGVAAVVAWRMVWPSWRALCVCSPPPKRRMEGWAWLPVVVPVVWMAARHGLPVWGLM